MKDLNLELIMSNVGNILLNRIAMGKEYQWSDELSYSEILRDYEYIKTDFAEMVSIASSTKEELLQIGFSKWDEESNILLIPIWAFSLIPDGTTLYSIDGEQAVKGIDEIDLDVRFGCIPYGLKL